MILEKNKVKILLRRGENNFITEALLFELFKLKDNQAKQLLLELEELGYIERIGIEGCWGLAIRGKLLANQNIKKLYKTSSIKQHLNALKERVIYVNSNEKYPFYIGIMKVTSKLPIQERINELNIVYTLIGKKMNPYEFDNLTWQLIRKSKRGFSNILDELTYPETAINEFLKSRSHILKLRKVKDDEIWNIEGHVIFDFTVPEN
ncbi:hypothetical protein [Sporocytophaga myxococcoides]|uniref:hypothetical protein n=1 Tax=Sporocytophaga myxococcoides TaxID=153721 RepID=UPI0004162044|nr:hypothetical protein [Sporocytophaga myxococcoides]